jgi:UDP-3-O-acyl N-acetylglucosamine deacetylase
MKRIARQHTIGRAVSAKGLGLHTGEQVTVELLPAPAGEGIVFERADLPGAPRVKATLASVNTGALARRTELVSEGGASVATVEHLLAACLGMGVDHLLVRLRGSELPIFDGSAQRWARLITRAGLKSLREARRPWRLRQATALVNDGSEICAIPAESMTVVFFVDLERAGMDGQAARFQVGRGDFEAELASARTFCFSEEVEHLRSKGLIRGGSLECAVVIHEGKPYKTHWRLPEELARHKLLDFLGDLAILGRPVAALLTARGAGHQLNFRFIQQLQKELSE